MKRIMLLLIITAIALASAGGTVAGFSDIEISLNNFVQTGNIDIKVVKRDANWDPIPGVVFTDDEPWGFGLEHCFDIPDAEDETPYTSNLLVWNAGTQDGDAYLHLVIVEDPDGVASDTWVKIWYDINNNTSEDSGETVEGWLADLASQHLPGAPDWPLEANTIRQVTIEMEFQNLPGNFTLIVDTEFILLSGFFSDTEKCRSFFGAEHELGGTPGFWRNRALTVYGQTQLQIWFGEIVTTDSDWFNDPPDSPTYFTMLGILKQPSGNDYEDKVGKFRSQYLATLLNEKSGRLGKNTRHELWLAAETYLGFSPPPAPKLSQIIDAIEGKENGDIFTPDPSAGNIELMKDVCDALNNLDI